MNKKEQREQLIKDLAGDFAPFVKDVESSLATTRNHYGRYGAMLTKLSKGNRGHALIFASAMIAAGANGSGVNDAISVFFPN